MLHGMQVVDDSAAPEFKEVLAADAVASPTPLPAADMCEGMLYRHALPQLGSALWCQLPFTQLLEESLIGMDVNAAAGGAGGTPLPQRRDLARVFWEVHGCIRMEGDAHLIGAADGAGLPVEHKGRLGIAIAVAHRPRFAINGQVLRTIPDQLAGQVATIEVDLS